MLAKLLNQARSLLPLTHRPLMAYEEYSEWRETYFSLHKDHQVEAAEKLGRAFCQHFKIRDFELEELEQRIGAEALIFGRYVNRHRAS